MSGLLRICVRSRRMFPWSGCGALLLLTLVLLPFAASADSQQRREREPNSVYAERRARLAATADAPIVLTGLTGREEDSQAYIFSQDENFYYLTGHNEEEAGL
ncbi:MAG TPA: aminopeptidase P N-terminal domain-containing protein, partial [Candidatus Acidoferrum sp.]|nr:aminopeptidase P N-terminal domain-containing protein [Candidatus Acidoferrum sp.]